MSASRVPNSGRRGAPRDHVGDPEERATVDDRPIRAPRQRDARVEEARQAVRVVGAALAERGQHPVAELADEPSLWHRDDAQPTDALEGGVVVTPQCSMR